jgi:hypothetical protein
VNRKRVFAIAALLFLFVSLSILIVAFTGRRAVAADASYAPPRTQRSQVKISVDQIPNADAPMPVLKLTSQRSPDEFVRKSLGNKTLEPLARNKIFADAKISPPASLTGAFDGDHLAAYSDSQSGDAQIFPSMTDLKPMSEAELERSSGIARQTFTQANLLGKDDTRVEFLKPLALFGANADPNGTKKKELVLAYVRLRRFVDKFPVYGPGSRAMLVVGAGGSVQGFLRRWKTGANSESVKPSRSREEVARLISAQLDPLTKSGEVEVLTVELAYYDGNQSFLQPVYRFTARVRQAPGTDMKTDEDLLIGYQPVGKLYEPLPVIGANRGPDPVTPRAPVGVPPRVIKTQERSHAAAAGSISLEDPQVARYVVRQDDVNWTNDANEFWSGLMGSPTHSLFTNSQYYWAEPRLFTNQAWFFINNVHVALTEVHGNWWYFTTLRNNADGVNIASYGPPGYGAAAGGKLCYWIIHSCEVIPAPDDTAQWPNPWWNVFGGLHSVIGYRTVMYIDDDVGGPYGSDIGWVASAVSSWLNETASSSAYDGNPTYPNHDGINKPMGRGATISMCGRENDSVFNISAQPRAGCLRIFWWRD